MSFLLNPFVFESGGVVEEGDPYFNNVVLLCGFNGADGSTSFEDDSNYNHTMTATGAAQVDTAQLKFGSGSLLLDGTSDFVSVPDSDGFNFAAGQFTAECWIRLPASAIGEVQNQIYGQWATSSRSHTFAVTSTGIQFSYSTNGTSTTGTISGLFTWVADTWYHVAVDRDTTNKLRLYVDGVMVGSGALAVTFFNSTASLIIGRIETSSSNDFTGWIDEFRLTKGVARYASDSGYTVPTAAFPRFLDAEEDQYIDNVVFLSGFEGTDGSTSFDDESSSNHTLTAVGNAQVDTAQKKFGASSALFDGTGDAITAPDSVDFTFGSEQFTVELFVRFASGFGTTEAFCGQWGATIAGCSWFFFLNSGSLTFRMKDTGTTDHDTTVAWTPTVDTWYHLAVDRDASNKFRIYRDGVMVASATYAQVMQNGTGLFGIGTIPGFESTAPLNGWIDELRITKGVARYASDSGFTVPAAAYPRPVKILDGLLPTGAWSMSRDLLTSFAGGSRYTDVSGAVSSLNDQSGNSRHLSQATGGNRPLVATAGPNNLTCADFDGSNDLLVGAAMSNFITASTGYVVVSFLPDTITTDSATVYNNHGVFSDGASQFIAMTLRNTDADVGDPDTIYAYNWDGNADAAAEAAIIAGTAYVAEWKHEDGNISLRVNGGSWVDVASGNTTSLTGLLTMGTVTGSSGTTLDGKVFEMAVFSTPLSSDKRDEIVADFMAHVLGIGVFDSGFDSGFS